MPSSSVGTQLPTPSPSPRKRKRNPRPSRVKPGRYLFIGRPGLAPFVFYLQAPITPANRRWLKTGSIDELDYLAQIDARTPAPSVASSRQGSSIIDITTSDTETDAPSAKKAFRYDPPQFTGLGQSQRGDWSEVQKKALWLAQLHHAEGKNWAKVCHEVNDADKQSPRSEQDCREKWREVKTQAFGV